MTVKKGLGKDIEKSLKVMDDLTEALGRFNKVPLKKGLATIDMEPAEEKELNKEVNEAEKDAFSLLGKIQDLKAMVRKARPKSSARFASRVVEGFLSSQP